MDSVYTVRLDENGIIRLHVSSKRVETIEDIDKLFAEVGKLTNGKKAPLLVTYDPFVFSSTEVNEYWSNPITACKYFSAEAFIAETVGLELAGSFYLARHISDRPVKMFNNEAQAINWLKTFI